METGGNIGPSSDRSNKFMTPRLPSIAEDNAGSADSPAKSSPASASSSKSKSVINFFKKGKHSKTPEQQSGSFSIRRMQSGTSLDDLATSSTLSDFSLPGEDHPPKLVSGAAREVSFVNAPASTTSLKSVNTLPVGLGIVEGMERSSAALIREPTTATFETVDESITTEEMNEDTVAQVPDTQGDATNAQLNANDSIAKDAHVDDNDDDVQGSDWESVADGGSISETSNYEGDEAATSPDAGDDAASTFTCEEAIPPPLNVQKRRRPVSRIPVLRVNRNSKHIQLANSPSFSPRRDSTFMRKIKEASEAKQLKLRTDSHPAMRDSPDVGGSSPALDTAHSSFSPSSTIARVDSGVGLGLGGSEDEGRATEDRKTPTSTFSPSSTVIDSGTSGSFTPVKSPSLAGDAKTPTSIFSPSSVTLRSSASDSFSLKKPPSSPGDDDKNLGQRSANSQVQATRAELGMQPQRYPAEGAWRHLYHPFEWDHENLMCSALHNPQVQTTSLPKSNATGDIHMADLPGKFFKYRSAAERGALGQKNNEECSICGKLCCKFAELLIASTTSSQDVEEVAKRMKARHGLSLLRSSHPVGVDLNAALMKCMECEKKVCPGCATRCTQKMCQIVMCKVCWGDSETCGIHEGFF